MPLDRGVDGWTSLTPAASLSAGLLSCSPHELRPHPAYARHKLSVETQQLATLEKQGELAFANPVLISRDRLLIDGYARCELAKRQGRSTLLCLEYDVSEDHALQLLGGVVYMRGKMLPLGWAGFNWSSTDKIEHELECSWPAKGEGKAQACAITDVMERSPMQLGFAVCQSRQHLQNFH
jgi:hypothetical protein